jgi:hypothetical protein
MIATETFQGGGEPDRHGAGIGNMRFRVADYRLKCIDALACEKAKERGFVSGYEPEDWRDAEAEVLAQLYGLTGTAC